MSESDRKECGRERGTGHAGTGVGGGSGQECDIPCVTLNEPPLVPLGLSVPHRLTLPARVEIEEGVTLWLGSPRVSQTDTSEGGSKILIHLFSVCLRILSETCLKQIPFVESRQRWLSVPPGVNSTGVSEGVGCGFPRTRVRGTLRLQPPQNAQRHFLKGQVHVFRAPSPAPKALTAFCGPGSYFPSEGCGRMANDPVSCGHSSRRG